MVTHSICTICKHPHIATSVCCTTYLLVQELWLQNNQVADHVQLLSLSSLPLLTTLFLAQNPLSTALKQHYRPAVVAALANLQVCQSGDIALHCAKPMQCTHLQNMTWACAEYV